MNNVKCLGVGFEISQTWVQSPAQCFLDCAALVKLLIFSISLFTFPVGNNHSSYLTDLLSCVKGYYGPKMFGMVHSTKETLNKHR